METGRGHENIVAPERRIAQIAPLRCKRGLIRAPLSPLVLEGLVSLLGESLIGSSPAFDPGDPLLSGRRSTPIPPARPIFLAREGAAAAKPEVKGCR